MHKTMVCIGSLEKLEIIRSQEFMPSKARLKFLKKMIILGPKTASLGPQFCRILVLGPHFWWSGGAWGPGAPWICPCSTSCMPHLHHINLGMNPLPFSLARCYPTNSSMAHNIYNLGYPADYFLNLKNIRTVDLSYLPSQLFIFGDQFCRKCDSDTIEYFRPDPQSVANEPDMPNLNVTSGHIKSSSTENGTDLRGVQSLVLAFQVSPGTQVFHADSADGSLPWDLSVVGECPNIVYPLDTFIYLNFSNDDIYPISIVLFLALNVSR